MEPWHIWLIIVVALISAEMLMGDFVLLLLGTAAIAGCLVAMGGLPLIWQLSAFALAAAVLILLVRPWLQNLVHRNLPENVSNVDAMTGQIATVVDPIGGEDEPGRAKLGSEEWRSYSENGATYEAGAKLEVARVDGATLILRERT